jgi:hypothetical protein
MKERCFSYEGCHGEGWLWDATDSGSGRQVYCDCEAGEALKRLDNTAPTRAPSSTPDKQSETSHD